MSARCRIGFVLMLGAAACESSRSPGSAPLVDAPPAQYAHDALPDDVQQRTLIDFEGKLAVVGYDVEPVGRIAPGSKVTLRLYWKRLGTIERGWNLFTHVVDVFGRRKSQVDTSSELRTKLAPHDWVLGKVYVDEQTFVVPVDIMSEATVLVGVWRGGYTLTDRPDVRTADLRLQVISGSDDGENRAIVTHIDTGKKPPPRWIRRPKS